MALDRQSSSIDRHPGCTVDTPDGCEECFLLATGASTDPQNLAWERDRKAQAIVDRIGDDELVWERTIRAIQGEVVKSTIGHTDWEMPDDIAEDIICAVVRGVVDFL